MKNKFRQLPKVLQKQILIYFGLGISFLLLFIILIFCTADLLLSAPCALISVYMLCRGTLFCHDCIKKKYILVEGICTEIEKSKFRKKVRTIVISTSRGLLKIPIYKRIPYLAVGDIVNVYLSTKTPMYEFNDLFVACSYYAIESRKET